MDTIAGVMRGCGHAEVQSIGAGATNQAVKAVAIARVFLLADGISVCCVPFFTDVIVNGQPCTALRLGIQPWDG